MPGQVNPTLVHHLSIPLMFLSGRCSTVVQKFMMEQRTTGRDIYPIHRFAKPWYLTLVMFVLEVFPLIFYQILLRLKRKTAERAVDGNLIEGNDATAHHRRACGSI
jgi:hypothetical protein